MKVVIAMDSFKGSMSSTEAGNAARDGILKVRNAQVTVIPMADGGEGTVQALVEGLNGSYTSVKVMGPEAVRIEARYGILSDGRTAVMEMAEAAGIIRIKNRNLNPWKASTSGVGEMIRDAIDKGCRNFIIGIGGSATTEGGIGMLHALGYTFYDRENNPLPPVPDSLEKIAFIDGKNRMPELAECHFQIACDVTNPLYGETGAVYVYGPQKGLKEEELPLVDNGMKNYAFKAAEFTGKDKSFFPGAGAAGGLGFAFLSFFPDVELKCGIDIVMKAVGLEKELEDADIVITGEGKLDGQTAMGKVPVGVAQLAKKYGCRVLAFAGGVTEEACKCNERGIDAFFPIVRGVTTLEDAMDQKNARKNMQLSVEQVFRIL